MENQHKIWTWAFVVLALLIVAAGAWWLWGAHSGAPITACTMEAKLCPDGSAVGRTGPNCEFAPCSDVPQTNSGVEGQITLGPTCPVMQNPPNPQCADRPYETTIQIIKVGSPQGAPFMSVKTDSEGRYSVTLPPGEYALQPVGGNTLPRCETKEVTVVASKMTEANLSCDTGIR